MAHSGIDLLLMPHGSPMPYKTSKVISEADIEQISEKTVAMAPHFPPQPPYAPRPKASCGDTNFQLLSAIIEAVTGQPIRAGLAAAAVLAAGR